MLKNEQNLANSLEQKGINRRSFLKYCGAIAATIGLSSSFIPKIAEALTSPERFPVVWLHFAECTGCSESFLRSTNPSVETILLDTISLDYHETLMVASGLHAKANLEEIISERPGEFFCITEGAIPTANNGIFGTIGGKTMLEIAREIIPQAKATIAFGTCAAFGGLAAAHPNPTGAMGVTDAIGVSTVNVSGCPGNHLNLVSTIANYLLFDQLPELDTLGRPKFAYENPVHRNCTKPYGCLEDLGCRGKTCYHNCPSVKFNDGTGWDIQAGHHCIGCAEPNFWDRFSPFYKNEYESKFYDKYAFVGTVKRT